MKKVISFEGKVFMVFYSLWQGCDKRFNVLGSGNSKRFPWFSHQLHFDVVPASNRTHNIQVTLSFSLDKNNIFDWILCLVSNVMTFFLLCGSLVGSLNKVPISLAGLVLFNVPLSLPNLFSILFGK